MPRLLEVHVHTHGEAFEWRLVEHDNLLLSGISDSRTEAQKAGDTALFDILSSGWHRDSRS